MSKGQLPAVCRHHVDGLARWCRPAWSRCEQVTECVQGEIPAACSKLLIGRGSYALELPSPQQTNPYIVCRAPPWKRKSRLSVLLRGVCSDSPSIARVGLSPSLWRTAGGGGTGHRPAISSIFYFPYSMPAFSSPVPTGAGKLLWRSFRQRLLQDGQLFGVRPSSRSLNTPFMQSLQRPANHRKRSSSGTGRPLPCRGILKIRASLFLRFTLLSRFHSVTSHCTVKPSKEKGQKGTE